MEQGHKGKLENILTRIKKENTAYQNSCDAAKLYQEGNV